MAVETTTTMSNEVYSYYESRFLEPAKELLVHEEGAQKSTRGKGQGKSTIFNRYTPLAKATTALTEGANGTEAALTSSQVTATLAEYGKYIKVSKLLSLTTIDRDGAEKAELLGQNMAETFDELARDALIADATVSYAGGKSALTAVAATDTLSASEVRKVRRALIKAKALKFANGMFMGKIGPDTEFDLIGDNTWVNAHSYKDGEALYKGYAGSLYGFDFLLTTNAKSEASTVSVFSNIFHGREAFGTLKLQGDMPHLYVKVPTASDTSNPLDRFSTMGWAGAYVAKVLVSAWILNHKSGATS